MSDDFRRCPSCHEYGWFGNKIMGDHRCRPVWECRAEWHADEEDGWGKVHALDAETAAEKYAEHYDCEGGEYAIIGRKICGDVIIQVRKPGDETFERWSIEAEAVPTYRAERLEDTPQEREDVPHD